MPSENLIQDIKKHSVWGIVMGVLTAPVGCVSNGYPWATATITTLLLGGVLIY